VEAPSAYRGTLYELSRKGVGVMTAGVYVIVNTVTGEEYIGQSANMEQRWREHATALRARAGNRVLQKAWDAYGESAFTFAILEKCADFQQTNAAEARHIAERQSAYNRTIPFASLKRRIVSMTWPADLADEIDAAAQARELTKSELVIRVMREWLATQ
jgi:GIY-YIG catalytic domain